MQHQIYYAKDNFIKDKLSIEIKSSNIGLNMAVCCLGDDAGYFDLYESTHIKLYVFQNARSRACVCVRTRALAYHYQHRYNHPNPKLYHHYDYQYPC